MIISASYKTDIPAFYGQWFVNRLQAGYCMMRNPLNRREIRVSLLPKDVDGIVFWTKNFRPFMKFVNSVESTGIPFIVQYTINGYPKSLEKHVVDWRKSVDTARALAERFGPRCIVWRYDTIILSKETRVEFHRENFQRIADALHGITDEVVISFMQLYAKTARNMDRMASEWANPWNDPPLGFKRDFAQELFGLAADRNMVLTVCSQPEIVTTQPPSRCIDAERIADVGGNRFPAKTLGNRPGCMCAASRDIGDYDTCPHGCVYCYAVRSQDLAVKRFKAHNPESEFLFDDPGASSEPRRTSSQYELDV